MKSLKTINIDWLGKRKLFIGISVLLMLAGLGAALGRYFIPGQEPFNLGVDFKGGTVVTAKFSRRPEPEVIRAALSKAGIRDVVLQPVTDKNDEVLIKIPEMPAVAGQQGAGSTDQGRTRVEEALKSLGPQAGARIEGTEYVGPVAGQSLRNRAINVTLLALLGILAYIAFRFDGIAYGAAAVLAVFHDVIVTLGFFSLFQWEISLTVIAALLTLVGFSVNDTIVTFDRIRENLKLNRRETLYNITNLSINQTLSRTIITGGLVLFSVIALVLFGGEVLRGFSLALLIGVIVGTYSTIGIASPIMLWFQQRTEKAARASAASNADERSGEREAKAGKVRQTKDAARA
jgi:preprotein translocase subunit SecF